MAIFGWIVFVLIMLYCTFALLFATYYTSALGGKVDKSMYVFIAILLAAWYFVYTSCPFTITVG